MVCIYVCDCLINGKPALRWSGHTLGRIAHTSTIGRLKYVCHTINFNNIFLRASSLCGAHACRWLFETSKEKENAGHGDVTCGDLLLLFGEHWERQQGGSSRKHLVRKHQFTTANGWELHSYSDYGVLRRADPTWSVRRDAFRYLTKRSSLGFCAAIIVLVLIKQSLALSAKPPTIEICGEQDTIFGVSAVGSVKLTNCLHVLLGHIQRVGLVALLISVAIIVSLFQGLL